MLMLDYYKATGDILNSDVSNDSNDGAITEDTYGLPYQYPQIEEMIWYDATYPYAMNKRQIIMLYDYLDTGYERSRIQIFTNVLKFEEDLNFDDGTWACGE